jgi:hypothetical protein
MSGTPFWEEGDDELFGESEEEHPVDIDHFPEDGHQPKQNVLAK